MLSKNTRQSIVRARVCSQAKSKDKEELNWDDVEQVDLVGIDIGYGLIPLVNQEAEDTSATG